MRREAAAISPITEIIAEIRAGRVVILVLVNEQGNVSDARVQRGVGGRNGIDTVVLDAVRSARFRPATKNGIPVKMWRTVVVEVKP